MALYTPVEGAEPKPSKFGLVNSKTLVKGGPKKWEAGIDIDSVACNADVRVIEICNTDHSVSSVEPGDNSNRYIPFFVQADYTCTTFGWKAAKYVEKATLALEINQNKAIEAEFWTGALAQLDETTDSEGNPNPNKYLASSSAEDVTPTPGTAVKPAYGLALLEQALADCGSGARGYIHTTRGVASTLKIIRKDDYLQTKLGTYVIAGAGYTGSGPTGALPSGSAVWMYATGPVSVRIGDVEIVSDVPSEFVNTSNNEAVVTAQVSAAPTWDGCCHFAVLVDLSLDYA